MKLFRSCKSTVERAVANADVENYTLADVVTEVQFETFLENPIEVLVDFEDISLTNMGNDMTTDQKKKHKSGRASYFD